MVSCRSCGRNILSGTIRCTKCSAPFHLSCSHRYQISAEGVFNVCCEPNAIPVCYNTRTRNKRQFQENIKNTINKANDNTSTIIEEQNNCTRLAKMVKIEKTVEIAENLIADDSNDCCEIIEEIYHENDHSIDLDDYDEPEEIIQVSLNNKVSNQSNAQLIARNNDVNNKITLETVWKGISSLQSSISNISQSLDTVSTQLNTFDPRIKELEINLNTIKAKTTNFDNVQNDVSGLKAEIERLMSELEQVKVIHKEKSIDYTDIFSEIRERDMKSRNVIIFNVAEDNLRLSHDYSTLEDINKFNAIVNARDTSRAHEILENIPNIDLDDLETRRIGRMNPNTCRPLRVILQNKEDVITVMRNRGLINKQYNVRTDLTRFQLQKLKELREELAKINVDRNNPQVTIKFISGDPKIIPIKRNLTKHE